MAKLFVASGGSNTAPYETWAKAATSLQTALTAASAGDQVIIQHDAVPSTDAENAANTTYTFPAVQFISASNDGASDFTPTPMGTANWIGNSTTNRSIALAGNVNVSISGVTFRVAGAGSNTISFFGASDGANAEIEDVYVWQGGTSASVSSITVGSPNNSFVRMKNSTLRFGATGSSLRCVGKVEFVGGGVSTDGSAPTTLMSFGASSGETKFTGFDAAHVTGTLCGVNASSSNTITWDRCKFGTGVTVLATQTPANKSSAVVYAFDCSSGDTHGIQGYWDDFGSVVSDFGIYFTAGPATQSWKIVTTANCSFATPFVTPPIFSYDSALSAITPYLEIARDGSTTPFNNNEVWAEFMAKVTTGTTLASTYSDRMALNGTPAAQAAGAGTGAWTGLSGTAASMKIDSGGSLTPAEVGDQSAQVAVGLASATMYADPWIRS